MKNYREITINEKKLKLIPLGECACGCGEKTNIAPYGQKRDKWVKGQPFKYINRHNARGSGNPMWTGGRRKRHHSTEIWTSDRGYVKEHILIAEQVLGKKLPMGAKIHHINADPFDNRKDNLVICQNHAYHHYLHQRERAIKATGNPNYLKCRRCGGYSPPEEMRIYPNAKQSFWAHPECIRQYARKQNARRRKL